MIEEESVNHNLFDDPLPFKIMYTYIVLLCRMTGVCYFKW